MKNIIIRTELLCKSFVSDGEVNNVIKNLDLDIYEGDFTIIMGSSGSGKSTLLYSISGLDEITSGKVFFENQNISSLRGKKMASLRKEKIGFVFQGINLIPNLNVYENILSPTYKTRRDRKSIEANISNLLDRMELSSHKNKFPNQMSGGQKQKVAICRALINNPKVLYADEPTGSLNSSQGEQVLDIFTDIHKNGQSIVMVTHDLKAALRGNRILYLKDGRIDGDLKLDEYDEENTKEREDMVYHFLKSKGW
ncbi:ABC transporter ATP-binding protein [Lachnospiraceae bacterium MD1]|jgi:putative ABC transport system ATP-binding protein|uniref:ABC transporter ATP-binding protein n=1 Tax=Variimorphobacter saccharofermentans TaxID=2755051 RepID=A0A839JYC5_9FIRM|nr:ABC transporter ATP-binding protein [Variimorphobacter saccharofermentans]MBB2182430.1 ABC transporter ATP-binding protein [Variimorphobacter saccharofermentans]